MASRPPTRRILKWTGLTATLLIVGLWAFSLWWAGSFIGERFALICRGGCLNIFRSQGRIGPIPHGWHIRPLAGRNSFGLELPTMIEGWQAYAIILPLWLPLLVFAIPTAWLFYRDRKRIPPSHCQKCGYNLTWNTSGRCPECGDPIPEQALKTP